MQELRTPFYLSHLHSGAKLVSFNGFLLPINYGSQIKEHDSVRNDAGMFDVSHMCITDVSGNKAKQFIRFLISNDVNKLDTHGMGKALYSGMLNDNAGIIDDLIVYLMPFGYRIITNAGTRNTALPWIKKVANHFDTIKITEQNNLAMLAIQGPNAIAKFIKAIAPQNSKIIDAIKPFTAIEYDGLFIARTGYTGENGLEIILPKEQTENIWNNLLKVGITPCGLGARDTLRLEAGMNLYGQDMDENTTPLECNMDWVVDLNDSERDFIGKDAYLNAKQQNHPVQVGLLLEGKGILRAGQQLFNKSNLQVGTVTSGTFSPTIKQSIAIARLINKTEETYNHENGTRNIYVKIRENLEPVKIVKLPFVRNGKQINNIK